MSREGAIIFDALIGKLEVLRIVRQVRPLGELPRRSGHREIRRRREEKKLTMDEAAQSAGLRTRQRWNGVESGERKNPSAAVMLMVARALGCKVEDLMIVAPGKKK